jgi:hypothetical protein
MAVNKVPTTMISTGAVVQRAYTQVSAVATGTTTIPDDDTIPQITEGTEFMSLSFTPTSATNKLNITIVAALNSSTVLSLVCALFQDAVSNALASISNTAANTGYHTPTTFTHSMVAGTTSAITFRFRAGPTSAGTLTFNGTSGSRRMGGVMASSIIITEVAV